MKLLLDTHTFLWCDSDPDRLSTAARAACQDSANTLLLSTASVWEMQIKHQWGKLNLSTSIEVIVSGQQEVNHVQILAITLPHVLALSDLPALHKDPFDRLLVAQAMAEGAVLVSGDTVLEGYPVTRLW